MSPKLCIRYMSTVVLALRRYVHAKEGKLTLTW